MKRKWMKITLKKKIIKTKMRNLKLKKKIKRVKRMMIDPTKMKIAPVSGMIYLNQFTISLNCRQTKTQLAHHVCKKNC